MQFKKVIRSLFGETRVTRGSSPDAGTSEPVDPFLQMEDQAALFQGEEGETDYERLAAY